MISVDEALKTVLSRIEVLPAENVPILEAFGRVLAEDIIAPDDIPPFDNSAMDGYALQAADLRTATKDNPVTLKVVADLAAGYVASQRVSAGEAIRIMTGAPIPEGADCVVMVEDTERGDGDVRILKQAEVGQFIRPAGEDVKAGQKILSKGKVLRPGDIGLLASVGKAKVWTIRRPKVAIISTGDELVEVGQPLEPGKIRNSNAYSLAAQAIEAGAEPTLVGIAKDTKEAVEKKIAEGLEADLLLTSGGVSVGDYDLVKDVLGGLGEMVFWKVAMKPAKPLAFGLIKGKPMFGLPGYPTSSMVSFEQFVRPSILKMSGRTELRRAEVEAELTESVRKRPGRRNFLRVIVEKRDGRYFARLTGPQASGILSSMSLANGFLVVPEEVSGIEKGETATIQLLEPIC